MKLSGPHLAWTPPPINTKVALHAIEPNTQSSNKTAAHHACMQLGSDCSSCNTSLAGGKLAATVSGVLLARNLLPAERACGLPVLATPSQTGSAQKVLAR